MTVERPLRGRKWDHSFGYEPFLWFGVHMRCVAPSRPASIHPLTIHTHTHTHTERERERETCHRDTSADTATTFPHRSSDEYMASRRVTCFLATMRGIHRGYPIPLPHLPYAVISVRVWEVVHAVAVMEGSRVYTHRHTYTHT